MYAMTETNSTLFFLSCLLIIVVSIQTESEASEERCLLSQKSWSTNTDKKSFVDNIPTMQGCVDKCKLDSTCVAVTHKAGVSGGRCFLRQCFDDERDELEGTDSLEMCCLDDTCKDKHSSCTPAPEETCLLSQKSWSTDADKKSFVDNVPTMQGCVDKCKLDSTCVAVTHKAGVSGGRCYLRQCFDDERDELEGTDSMIMCCLDDTCKDKHSSCTPECEKPSQKFNTCASDCTKTCDDPTPMCTKQCVAKCQCPQDTPILHDDTCIALKDCPVKECEKPSQKFNTCASDCTKTCDDPNPKCTKQCVAKCQCPQDTPILHDDTCIALKDCPVKECEKPSQKFNTCASDCTKTCDDPNPKCTKQCVAKCQCPQDTPILHDDTCIALKDCPVKGPKYEINVPDEKRVITCKKNIKKCLKDIHVPFKVKSEEKFAEDRIKDLAVYKMSGKGKNKYKKDKKAKITWYESSKSFKLQLKKKGTFIIRIKEGKVNYDSQIITVKKQKKNKKKKNKKNGGTETI